MAIATQEFPRETWRSYFEELTDVVRTVDAKVEMVGQDIGGEVADERQIVTDITYDDRDDVIIVGLDAPGSTADRAEHLIEHPQKVFIATGAPPPLEVTLEIGDSKRHQWLICLGRPPALPGE